MSWLWSWTTLAAAIGAVLAGLAAWWLLSDAIAAIGAGIGTLVFLKLIELVSARGRSSS